MLSLNLFNWFYHLRIKWTSTYLRNDWMMNEYLITSTWRKILPTTTLGFDRSSTSLLVVRSPGEMSTNQSLIVVELLVVLCDDGCVLIHFGAVFLELVKCGVHCQVNEWLDLCEERMRVVLSLVQQSVDIETEIGGFMCWWSGCDCLHPSTMEFHGERTVIAPPSCVRLAIGLQVTTSKRN